MLGHLGFLVPGEGAAELGRQCHDRRSDSVAYGLERRGRLGRARCGPVFLRGGRPWVGGAERHEAFVNRAVVKGHRLVSVAADTLKLGAARTPGTRGEGGKQP